MHFSAIPDITEYHATRTPDSAAFYEYSDGTAWRAVTWSEYQNKISSFARGLKNIGIKSGDIVAIMLPSSAAWAIADQAVLTIGAVVAGLDPNSSSETINYFLRNCRARYLIAFSPAHLDAIDPAIKNQFEAMIFAKSDTESLKSHSFETLLSSPACQMELPSGAADSRLAVIGATSGTSGDIKLIKYTHADLLGAADSILSKLGEEISAADRTIAWLPPANLMQRMLTLCAFIRGAEIYFIEDPLKLVPSLQTINPTVIAVVPRLLEKIYAEVENQRSKLRGFKRALLEFALTQGRIYSDMLRRKVRPGIARRSLHLLADRLVLVKLRKVFGNRIRILISGSAPAARWLLEFYHSIGVLVLEAYGLSENAYLNCMNTPAEFRFGAVGKPCPGVELQIAEDNEIYLTSPALNGTPLKTGDTGYLDSEGFLFLTGRTSEIIKTSTGRRISPANIETVLKQARYVENVVVLGDGEKRLAALITVKETESAENLHEIVRSELIRLNMLLAPYERISNFAILKESFTIKNGLLTSSLKLRRNEIHRRYRHTIEKLFEEAVL